MCELLRHGYVYVVRVCVCVCDGDADISETYVLAGRVLWRHWFCSWQQQQHPELLARFHVRARHRFES